MRPNMIPTIYCEYLNGNLDRAATFVRNTTKEELAHLLVNPHKYREGTTIWLDKTTRYDFENFVLNSLRK